MNTLFRRFAAGSAAALGSPWIFAANVLVILLWLGCGPLFDFSDTWQLWVNTATTVVTYLAVFLIQNTQNRDAAAMHLKLDELISSMEGARNRLVDLQSLSDAEISALQEQFHRLQARASQGELGASKAVRGEPT